MSPADAGFDWWGLSPAVCLPQRKFIPVPAGLDPAEAVAVVLPAVREFYRVA